MSLIFDTSEDEIFQTVQVAPKMTEITEKQKNDPLRKAKIILSSHLSSLQTPITKKELMTKMCEEEGYVYDYKKDGFTTLDELLQACTDTVVCHKSSTEPWRYSAVTTDSNRDISRLVENQKSDHQLKSFFKQGSYNGKTSHGSVFRNKRGEKITSAEEAMRKQQAYIARDGERTRFKSKSMSVERVKDYAKYIDERRSELQELSRQISNGQDLISLLVFQTYLSDKTSLPMWGKILPEEELYNSLNVPQHGKYIKLTKINDNYFIDTCPFSEEEEEGDFADNTGARVDQSTMYLSEDPKKNMTLLEPDYCEIEETGPGFRRASKNRPNNTSLLGDQNAQIEQLPRPSSAVSTPNDLGFGQGDEFTEAEGTRRVAIHADSRVPRRAGRQKVIEESIAPTQSKHTVGTLVQFIMNKGSINYNTLVSEERAIVDNSKLFIVINENLSNTIVQLRKPIENIEDIDCEDFSSRTLIEADIRWLVDGNTRITEDTSVRNFQLAVFVPPRGLLFIDKDSDETVSEEINGKIREAMEGNRVPVKRSSLVIGKPYLYEFFDEENGEMQYFRVIVSEEGDDSNGKTLRVFFIDLPTIHKSDVKCKDLFELPEEFNVKNYAPTIQWAALPEVDGTITDLQLKINVQLSKNRNCVGVYYRAKDNSIPYADFVCRNELGELEFMSSLILRYNGNPIEQSAIEKFPHYKISCDQILRLASSDEVFNLSELEFPAECENRVPSTILIEDARTPINAEDPFDFLFLKFQEMVQNKDSNAVYLYQTINCVTKDANCPAVFRDMKSAMKDELENNFNDLF
ncbi:unnamed protein product [Caenorhabditis angaria]|uniref:HTH OST-type domain-containing protein n=1 Tax=Caenorhabditis angaria TaxID=860376 RepID=A0A9P1I526_9PELO|nr:unnamed protein product [Caenorhabditis angaria]